MRAALLFLTIASGYALYGEESSLPKTEKNRKPEERVEVRAAIRKKLSRHISCEFDDTPFDEAMQFFNSLAKVGIVVDPQASDNAKTPITLKLNDLPIADALTSLCTLANLRWDIRDRIFISKRAEADTLELEIYSLEGLVRTTAELGYDWALVIGGPEVLEKAKKDYAEREKEEKAFADTIRALNPKDWEDPMASMELMSSKLVVMQTQKAHSVIAAHLAKLKAAHVNK